MLGISTPHGEGVAQLAFFGLFALQHRGQEAAGIAVSDGHRARVHKQPGLVSHVFTNETLKPLTGYHSHRPHPVLDDRLVATSATSSRSSSRRCTARWRSPTTATSSTPRRCATSCSPGLRADRHQRLRGDDADARRRRRARRGRSASSARCRRGRARSRSSCWPPTGCSPCATRGASGRCRSGGSPTAATPSPARRAPCRRSAASTSPRSSRARSSRCRAPSCTAARRSPPAPRPGPLHVRVRLLLPSRLGRGTAATSTTPASGSAPSWPPSRPSTPTS